MRKSEMNEAQLASRTLLVGRLAAAGWRSTVFNENFDRGLDTTTEASMEYSNSTLALRVDLKLEDPRIILYIDAPDGRTLGLVFKCMDRLDQLLTALIFVQDTVSQANIKEVSETLLAACPRMFKISESGDRLIPVVSHKKS